MKRKVIALLWIFMIISTAALCGDLRHAVDPRGKIENIVGVGDFVWNIDQQKRADCEADAKEVGENFTIRDIRWTITGQDQDWIFTRITRLGDDNEPTIKRERFWVTIMMADGVWVTRAKYRFREGKYQKDDTDEVGEKDKGSKFSAQCRITGEKIILAAAAKKEGYIFRLTKKDELLLVNLITTHDLRDWTMDYKKK